VEKDKYSQDGVNIEAGDVFSSFCGEISRRTYKNSNFVKVTDLSRGNFRGPRGYRLTNLPEDYLETGAVDGVGTKVVVIASSGSLRRTANDVIAMTAMDITRYGGLPLIFMNILDVNSLGECGSETFKEFQGMMVGLGEVANENNYVVLTGETAELGVCVGSENLNAKNIFNWGGVMLGVYHPKKMILGDTLAPGQLIIALPDKFRSNGHSTVRKSLAFKYGLRWWENIEAVKDIMECASPSVLYDRMLNFAHGWFTQDIFEPEIKMHLIVHLSGGAFESKLGSDMLKPLGLSAELDNLFDPPEIMKKCAEWRGMTPRECYKTWNGGQGALAVINPEDKKKFLSLAKGFNIEARVAGKITEKRDYTVAIKSKFGDDEMLFY
jgi:phosphoribosylaminoimidazole (AIR) synthetase